MAEKPPPGGAGAEHGEDKPMELISQKMRHLAPEMDPLRLGTGWKPEDLAKPQIMIESTYGDSHPGSGHLNHLVEAAREGVAQAGGFGARYYCTILFQCILILNMLIMPSLI